MVAAVILSTPDEYQTGGIIRRRMSWDEFCDSDFSDLCQKAEWVNGEASLMIYPASLNHIEIAWRLENLLRRELHGVLVFRDAGFRLADRLRAPDLMVIEPNDVADRQYIVKAPLIVVEILSPSTRHTDLFDKIADYQLGGAQQYWIVDPAGWLIVRENTPAGWRLIATIDQNNPQAEIKVNGHGSVKLQYAAIFENLPA